MLHASGGCCGVEVTHMGGELEDEAGGDDDDDAGEPGSEWLGAERKWIS